MTESNGNGNARSWMEIFRIITPVMLLVLSAMSTLIMGKIDTIEERTYAHSSNDEIHSPKSIVVTKAEFDLYQQFRGQEMAELRKQVADFRLAQDKQLAVSLDNNEKLDRILNKR